MLYNIRLLLYIVWYRITLFFFFMVMPMPLFALFFPFWSHRQRSKRALQTVVYHRLPRSLYLHEPDIPTPPLIPVHLWTSVLSRIFFNFFFWIFMFLQCCDILRSSLGFLCKIILFIALMMLSFTLVSSYAVCAWTPFINS